MTAALLRNFDGHILKDETYPDEPVGVVRGSCTVRLESKTGGITLTDRQAVDLSRFIYENIRKRGDA